MEKVLRHILAMRGPEYRPFAIEVSADEIRLAIYGGTKGFAEAPTCETSSHTDIETCLMEGIELLEQARLFSPSREPYYRLPHHNCVFLLPFVDTAKRHMTLQRRHLFRQVPRSGDEISFSSSGKSLHIDKIVWQMYGDEIHAWLDVLRVSDIAVAEKEWTSVGWELRSAMKPQASTQ